VEIHPFGATVLVDGWQLTGAVDRLAEARLQAQLVPEDAPEVWVYGVGLGDLVRVLLERPVVQKIHVCILSAELHDRLRPLDGIDPSRLVLHQPGEVEEVSIPFTFVPGELRHADMSATRLRDELITLINLPFNQRVQRELAQAWADQERQNAEAMATDQHVSAMFGRDRRPAIVVAGGPTASAHLDWIKAHQQSHQVIAVSRALLPLLEVGITPDVVVHIDPFPFSGPLFPGPEDQRAVASVLLYLSAINPALVSSWRGQRAWMREADLFSGGSVVHAAADLAVQRGATEVHLVGVDFCLPGGQGHLAGARGESLNVAASPLRTVDGFGRSVPTQEALVWYHRGFETLIAERPGIRWIKHDRRGVPLRGAEWSDGSESRRAA